MVCAIPQGEGDHNQHGYEADERIAGAKERGQSLRLNLSSNDNGITLHICNVALKFYKMFGEVTKTFIHRTVIIRKKEKNKEIY